MSTLVIEPRRVQMSVTPRDTHITIESPGRQGPAGPPGDDPGLIVATAAIALSGHRVVTTDALGNLIYADASNIADLHGPFWLTERAISQNASDHVRAYGEVDEPSWSWTPDTPLYLGTSGVLTATVLTHPTAEFLVELAVAITATRIYFDPKPPVRLA